MFQSDQSDVILCSVISDYDRYACGASLDNASFSCATFLLVVLALGIGLILATIAVKYRDVLHLYSVLMAVLMYLTPVIYPMSILPEWLYHLVMINPLTSILIMFRNVVIYGRLPDLVMLLVTAAEAVLCLGVGCWFFYKHQDGFIFDL